MAQKERLTRKQVGRMALALAALLAAAIAAYCLYWYFPWSFGGTYRASMAQMQFAKEKAAWLLDSARTTDSESYPNLPSGRLDVKIGGAIPWYSASDGRVSFEETASFPVYVEGNLVAIMFVVFETPESGTVAGAQYGIGPLFPNARSVLEQNVGCAKIDFVPWEIYGTSEDLVTRSEMPPEIAEQVMVSDPDIRF